MSDRNETGTGWPDGAQPAGQTDALSTSDSEPIVDGEPTESTPTKSTPTKSTPANESSGSADDRGGEDSNDGDGEDSNDGDGDEHGEPPDDTGRARLARRISAAGTMIGLLFGLLGFGLVVQLRSHSTDPQLASARPEDLVRILSDLDARQSRLRSEI